MRRGNIIWIIIAVIFVVAALGDIFSSSNFSGMNTGEKFFVIRFILFIGLFIGGVISYTKLKSLVMAAICGMAAFAILFSGC